MNKKFTILTSAYNSGRYIEAWADSIMSQKYRPLEVVCIEDVSIDNTWVMLKKFSKKIESEGIEFKLIKNTKKLFCGSSYNKGFRKVTGSYIGILDSDDMLEPFACEFIVGIYEKFSNVTWIYTQYNKYNRRMDRIIKRGFCQHPGKNKSILQMERNNINVYGHWRTFSNRIKSNRNLFGRGLKGGVDKHLGIRLEEEGVGMFVDRECYKYRTRTRGEKSIVHTYSLKKIRASIVAEAKKRRKKNRSKVYSILKYKG